MEDQPKTRFDKFSEILKTTIWPAIVLIVLFFYHTEVKKLIDNSTKVSIGSFSMEVKREAASQGFSGLGDIITGLNEGELKMLLSMSQSEYFGLIGRNMDGYTISPDSENWTGLEKAGLVEFKDFSFKEAEDYMLSLGGVKRKVFIAKDGTYGFEKNDRSQRESYVVELNSGTLSQGDKMKLETFSIRLSPKGKQAISIILKTLDESLKD